MLVLQAVEPRAEAASQGAERGANGGRFERVFARAADVSLTPCTPQRAELERQRSAAALQRAQAEAELNSRLQAELRSMRMCFETHPSATPTAASM